MRIFLATTSLDDIRWATDAGLIDGIVATPTIIASESPQGDAREVLTDIAKSRMNSPCNRARGARASRRFSGSLSCSSFDTREVCR